MPEFPKKLQQKLDKREENASLRSLSFSKNAIDFSSNDYLGYSKSKEIFEATHQFLTDRNIFQNGATGSRLLTGNHSLYQEAEDFISTFHKSETALIFNSGYDANVGFFSCIPQRGDIILYDEYCHASIRDGIQLSHAKSYKFIHNDLDDLEALLEKNSASDTLIYIVTESVFSMDGDSPDLEKMALIAEKFNAFFVVDEAHALGVFGTNGEGLIQHLNLQDKVFARIMTFGKGLGCHGAAILGTKLLKNYLVNFSRSFIYTTGLSPHSVASIFVAYQFLSREKLALENLRENIAYFNQEKQLLGLKQIFVRNKSAIQSAIIPGNEKVKSIALKLQENGFDVKAILSPTVPEGQERLRFCLHSYASKKEISQVLELLSNSLF